MKVYLIGKGWNAGTVLDLDELISEVEVPVAYSTLFQRVSAWDPSVSKEAFHNEIYVRASYNFHGMPAYKYSTTILNSDIYVRG